MDAGIAVYEFGEIEVGGEAVQVITRNGQSIGLDALEILFGLADARGAQALGLLLQVAVSWWEDGSLEAGQEASQALLDGWLPALSA